MTTSNKITKKSLVTLVELPATENGELLFEGSNGKVSHNVYSHFKLPSRALHILEGILRDNNWENIQSINPEYHGKRGRLTENNLRRILNSDILLISSITGTSPQTMKLIKMYSLSNPEGTCIAGGYDSTFRPESYLREGADIVVCGEAEKTLPLLMDRLIKDKKSLEDINGLIYKKRENIEVTNPQIPLSTQELVQISHPFYDKDTAKNVRVATIETSRGCPNDCEFCGVHEFYKERKYRIKSIDYIIEELKQIKDMGFAVFYSADNLTANPSYSKALFEAIAEENLSRWSMAQVSVDVVKHPEILKKIKGAGIELLCIGVESFNQSTLDSLGKPYNSKQNIESLKILNKEGFFVHGMMMPGGDGDTPQSLKYELECAKKYFSTVQWFPPGPLPGTRLRKRIEKEGRLLRDEEKWNLYDGHHVLTRPLNFTPYELQKTINQMNYDFYTNERNRKIRDSKNPKARIIYDSIQKGINKVLKSNQMVNHLEFLKSIS